MLKECGTWLRAMWRPVRRSPGGACVIVALVWLLLPWSLLPLAAALTVAFAGRTWALLRPASFSRVGGPIRGWWWRGTVLRHWEEVAEQCRLGHPEVRRTRVVWPHVRFTVRPAVGHTAGTYEAASEALRMAVGASRLRVEHDGPRDLLLTFTIGDELRAPFAAEVSATEGLLTDVPLGKTERGGVWRLAVGPQTLVAGCSGSGKGSVFWSFAFALAPGVHEGRVQLHGIDLKGGMEIRMGDGLFTTSATDEASAVVSLERLVDLMRDRNRAYAGRLRSHDPTVEQPLHVVMIDELAALTAYCTDRDVQRRAERAINLLCSQGRASGFIVFACLQDPRKEVIPSRGLFTQMVGLRLKDLSETAMVLGEVAVQSGAHCHRITRGVPGTGYVVPEDGSPPMRVRAGYASDDAIRDVAARFAAPERIEIPHPPAEAVDEWRPRRSSRSVT